MRQVRPGGKGKRRKAVAEADSGTALHLLETIEQEIIPRLMMVHRGASPQLSCVDEPRRPSDAEVDKLAWLAVSHDLTGSLTFIEELVRGGMSLEHVLLELIAPTARKLGDQWLEDERTFAHVAAGLGTLHQLLHILGPSFAPDVPHRGLVVLTAAPEEQHTLGLYLVGEFLRRAGWGVHVDPAPSPEELLDFLAKQEVEALGISVSNDRLLEPLVPLIRDIRRASRNPAIGILLGGALELGEFARRHKVVVKGKDPREVVRWLDSRSQIAVTER